MSFTPIAWRHAFPVPKSAAERVRGFETEQVRSLIQFQNGIGEVVPSHLMPCVIQYSLKDGAGFL